MNLYDFQKEILAKSGRFNKVAYYLDMGLGKTFIGSEKMRYLGTFKNLLICQKSKIDDWKIHFAKYYKDYKTYDLTKEKEYKIFKSTDHRNERFIAVINYELVWRREVSYSFYGEWTLILDESSQIQNHTAKRTRYILGLNPSNVILLSGTPVGGKYENLWSQLRLLGYDKPYKVFFDRYVKFFELKNRAFPIKVAVGYKNEDELKKTMRELGCFFLKTEEVMTLPSQTFIDINIPTPPYFKDFIKNSIVNFNFKNIDNEEEEEVELVGDTTLTKILYLRQICGIYNKAKWEAFGDLLDSSNDRFIVFYCYNKEFEIISKICKERGRALSMINGSIRDLRAYDNEINSVTAIQYQAGAMGLNLQKANRIIYWSPIFSSELFEQSKKRIHRIGQEAPCFYYLLKSGFDNNVYRVLSKREDYTNKLFEEDLLTLMLEVK